MSSLSKAVFIDATLFMGMHSADRELRRRSLTVMSGHFGGRVHISLEQVGLCDDVVWSYPRKIQDDYYPFMDCLHSQMDIQRLAYSLDDMKLATTFVEGPRNVLSPNQALVIAQVVNHAGLLFTHDEELSRKAEDLGALGDFHDLNDALHSQAEETPAGHGLFSPDLDLLYQRSTCLIYE